MPCLNKHNDLLLGRGTEGIPGTNESKGYRCDKSGVLEDFKKSGEAMHSARTTGQSFPGREIIVPGTSHSTDSR